MRLSGWIHSTRSRTLAKPSQSGSRRARCASSCASMLRCCSSSSSVSADSGTQISATPSAIGLEIRSVHVRRGRRPSPASRESRSSSASSCPSRTARRSPMRPTRIRRRAAYPRASASPTSPHASTAAVCSDGRGTSGAGSSTNDTGGESIARTSSARGRAVVDGPSDSSAAGVATTDGAAGTVALTNEMLQAGRTSRASWTVAVTSPPTSAVFHTTSSAAGDQLRMRVNAHARPSSAVLWIRYVSSQARTAEESVSIMWVLPSETERCRSTVSRGRDHPGSCRMRR